MTTQTKMDKLIAEIAKGALSIDTLETRNMDGLDFHDVAVWQIKAALKLAYLAGVAAGKANR